MFSSNNSFIHNRNEQIYDITSQDLQLFLIAEIFNVSIYYTSNIYLFIYFFEKNICYVACCN